ncbi:DUF1205 domain-containing protein [Frankia sp. AgB1.9]|uniref:glycosyltransferase n=1 Tax=unclassified Frankia TaxID=2632575 RepID=UPI00193414F0|nr:MULTISPECIES: glycosyltransferase [unclassified Frankia]MBL7489798.1 DUF1205 domain-containing protein [Frankia sp. AgW1.1]MBL7550258.1 DUF1205 domain-containing protein [Frankia sp. AgB1.9]MBL7623051.1 DUF1205 domain-containing protein [Frankia sp. AgB1.8]
MKVLFSAVPMHGHFFPLVTLAHAFRAAGHEVLVGVPENLVDAVTGAGLPAAVTGPPMELKDVIISRSSGEAAVVPTTLEERLAAAGRAWGTLAGNSFAGTRALLDAWRPDLVISEPSEFSAPMHAAALGIPWVRHNYGITWLPQTLPFTAEEVAAELAQLGLDGLPEPDAVINVCPPSVASAEDATALPSRYVPYNGPGVLPSWALAPRTRPRVLLTFGSLVPHIGFRDFVGVLRDIATGVPKLGAEVVIGCDPEIATKLGDLGDGVLSVGWQPLNLSLAATDVIIHHGGAGCTLTSLAFGTPQLVCPQIGDQFPNAFTVMGVGAGKLLMPEQLDVDVVLKEVGELLASPGYGEKARAVAAEVAAMPAPAQLVTTLVELAAG